MFRIFGDLSQLVMSLPPWALWPAAGITVVVAVPIWLRSVRVKQIRNAVRKLITADGAERERWSERAMMLAGTTPFLLSTVVREAIKRSQLPLRNEALARLKATGKLLDDVREYELAFAREKPQPFAHPLEAIAVIERLLEDGLSGKAAERLKAARRQFPSDGAIAELHSRLAQ